jgi:hypothetical protein
MTSPASYTLIPCPLTTNCLQGGGANSIKLTSAQKKAAELLSLELELLPSHAGIQRLLFITLTFENPVPDRKHREACCLKIRKYLLQKVFQSGVTVLDRSAIGRPHNHVVVVGPKNADYRAGFDFDAWHSSRAAEQRWNESGHTDHAAEQQWRAMTAKYTASATQDLRTVWQSLSEAAQRFGFRRINALPIRHPVKYARYLAGCITNGLRQNHPDDRGARRYRFWGDFPRKVTLPFVRTTRGATRWHGKLAFCARILEFKDYDDFKICFGSRWFIYLRGIFRLVPIRIAEASLLSPNLPLNLLALYRRETKKIETELLDRRERFGRP